MTTVRIYQLSKTAMQSGKRKTNRWLVRFETDDPLTTEPLMGWVESHDMLEEVHLSFPTLSEALHFATIKGFAYTICTPPEVIVHSKSYATNFTCPRVRGR